jgi:dsRNA-specific ribonuclease
MQNIGQAYRQSPETWERDFFEKIYGLLVVDSQSIPKNIWDKIMGDEGARNVWIDCFTHYSVSFERNYEVKETFGDKLLSSALYYLFLGNPQDSRLGAVLRSPNPSELMTQINKQFTSKLFLREKFYTKMDNLHQYIRCRQEFARKTDIMEDVFESFISAIQLSVDRASWEGKFLGPGFVSVTKFVHWFFTRKLSADEFDLTGKKDIKTYMKEFLEKFYRYTTGRTDVTRDDELGVRTFVVHLNPQAGSKSINPFASVPQPFYLDPDTKTISLTTDPSTRVVNVELQTDRASTIKDIEPVIYNKLLDWFKTSREHTRNVSIFEEFNSKGYTTFEILNNLIPTMEDYEALRQAARKMNLDPRTINIKRSEFREGDISIIIWAKHAETEEKTIMFETYIPKLSPGTQANPIIIETIRKWLGISESEL